MEQKRENKGEGFFSKAIDIFINAIERNDIKNFLAKSTNFQEMTKAAVSSMDANDIKLVNALNEAKTFSSLLDLTEKYIGEFEKQPVLEQIAMRVFFVASSSFSQTATFASHVIPFKKELQLHMLRNDYSLKKTNTSCQ